MNKVLRALGLAAVSSVAIVSSVASAAGVAEVSGEQGKIFDTDQYTVVKRTFKKGETLDKHEHPGYDLVITVLKGKFSFSFDEKETVEAEEGQVIKLTDSTTISGQAVEDSSIVIVLVKDTVTDISEDSVLSAVKDLSEWSGDWISATQFMQKEDNDKALAPVYEEVGKKDGISGQAWKQSKLEKWDTGDVQKMRVEADSITFTLNDGTEVKDTYIPEGTVKTPYKEGKNLDWYVFVGKNEGAFKYVALRPSGKKEALSHFHFRIGKTLDDIKSQNVFRTVIAPDSTIEQLGGDFKE